jgi:hypothetical protein
VEQLIDITVESVIELRGIRITLLESVAVGLEMNADFAFHQLPQIPSNSFGSFCGRASSSGAMLSARKHYAMSSLGRSRVAAYDANERP